MFLKGKIMSLSIKFYVTFKDKNEEEQTVDVWSDSSSYQEVIETFESDYGDDYLEIVEVVKA